MHFCLSVISRMAIQQICGPMNCNLVDFGNFYVYHRISTNLPNGNLVVHITFLNMYQIDRIAIWLITLKCKSKRNLRHFGHTVLKLKMEVLPVTDPGYPRRDGVPILKLRASIIFPFFPKNCMKLKKWTEKRGACL